MNKKLKKIQPRSFYSFTPKLSVLDGAAAYAKLRETVTKEGVLNRSYGYYTFTILLIFFGFFISAYNLFVQKSPLQLIVWGIIFSFFSVQIAGLFHDAGHRAIFKSTRFNDIFGYIFGAMIAAEFTSWKTKHNMHHAHPNQEDKDPDVELPLLSFTKEKFLEKKGLAKLFRRYQAYLYYPLGTLVFISVRTTGFKYFIKNFRWGILWQVIVFSLGLFAWFVLPFLIFDLTKALILLAVINVVSGIYLINVFAPNHKGMPYVAHGVKLSFIEHQIATSRNIYGNWLSDFIYMGLNYQIEHHLFPNCPRNKLNRITPHLLALCKRLNLEYTNVSALTSNKMILSELHEIAKIPTKTL